ncbi:MAG TPA: hypothetical protein VFT22_34490 [Kofleriaceae bacterium]|nr:hypothetical protein [Kofleriaceae bacterium]
MPELVDLVTPHADGSDELEPILALEATADHAGAEDVVRTRLARLVPELTHLLRQTGFVLDHVLVVARNQAAERWAGLRRRHRAVAAVRGGEPVEDHPMLLDRGGRICVDLWPLAQVVAPTEGAEPELFLFDGRGRHGARLIAAPAGFEHHDPGVWEWIAARLLGETAGDPVTGSDDQPPYLGLTPFGTADAARFVGREADLVAIAVDDVVALYRLPSGELVRQIKHPAKVNAMAFARSGHDLASASIDGSLLVTREGREPLALPTFAGGIDAVGFAQDGRVIAAGQHGKLRMYDPVLATVQSEVDLQIPARSFRMSSDGHRMIVIPTNAKPRAPVLWDLDHDRVLA